MKSKKSKKSNITRIPSIKFGVEIEINGLRTADIDEDKAEQMDDDDSYWTEEDEAYKAIKKAFTKAGLKSKIMECKDANLYCWKITDDASCGFDGGDGIEICTPPLQGRNGVKQLFKALQILKGLGARVNSHCGLHVHVEMKGLTLTEMKKIIKFYDVAQPAIEKIMPDNRRECGFCEDISYYDIFDNANDIRNLEDFEQEADNLERDCAINISAYPLYGTFEFRKHSGSINFYKIMAWVNLLDLLIAKAKTTPIQRVEKFTDITTVKKLMNIINAPNNLRNFYYKRAKMLANG